MKRKILRRIGIIMIVCGVGILSLFAYRKISRELYLRKLLKENIVFEIPRLNIKVPVLEGTDQKALQVSAGHFKGTGALGKVLASTRCTVYILDNNVFVTGFDLRKKGDSQIAFDLKE